MKKTVISLVLIIITLFTINLNVEGFTTPQKYYECTRWEIKKGNLISENSSKKSGKECSKTFKNSKVPKSLTECFEKTKSGFLGVGNRYNVYSANLKLVKAYKRSPLVADYDNCSGSDAKKLNNCEEIGKNSSLCGLFDSCGMKNGSCVSLSSWQSKTACSEVETAGGGRAECEALGCTWSNSKGCTGTATIKDENHPDNKTDSSTGNTSKTEYNALESNCKNVFGDFSNDLKKIFKIFEIVAPLIVVLFSIYDYLIALVNKDADALKKCNSKLIKRIVLMVILFFLPTLITLLLNLLGNNYGVCLDL